MNGPSVKQQCPKCGGKMFLYNDYNGWYEQCLQCSLTIYLDVVYKGGAGESSSKTPEIIQSVLSE